MLDDAKKNVQDLELATRSVLHHLEFKANQKVPEDGSEDELHFAKVTEFCNRANEQVG